MNDIMDDIIGKKVPELYERLFGMESEAMSVIDEGMTLMEMANKLGPSSEMARSVREALEVPSEMFGKSPMMTATQVIAANDEMFKQLNEWSEKYRHEAWEPVWAQVVSGMMKGKWVRIA